jgi:phage N-6-adenine-methyltransferase
MLIRMSRVIREALIIAGRYDFLYDDKGNHIKITRKNMSKLSDERTTPDDLFFPLHKEFQFTIDVAATDSNKKVERYYSRKDSAFKHKWNNEVAFMNPPYSELRKWLRKAYNERFDATIVAVLPCDGSTRWFHDYIWDESKNRTRPGVEIRFPSKRFKFSDYDTGAKFATLIAIFRICPG